MKTFIIAEIGINHNGDLNLAKKLISAAHWAGADAVKFQMRTIDTVYTEEFLNSPRDSPWGTTQRAQKEGLELDMADYATIDHYCKDLEIEWSASCWDLQSFKRLEDGFDPPWHKIASPMTTSLPFVNKVARAKKLTFISTGMTTGEDLEEAVGFFIQSDAPVVLLHCVSIYPCPPEKCQLQHIDQYRQAFGLPVGYSGHEVGLAPTLAAVALDATTIERHLTLDRAMYGSDHAASIEPGGFKRMVDAVREIEKAKGDLYPGLFPEELENAKKMRYWE